MDIKDLFSKNLRRIRESRGLTQSEFGRLVKLSPSYVSQLETGVKGFTADSLAQYAKVLGCSPSDFISEKPDLLTVALEKRNAIHEEAMKIVEKIDRLELTPGDHSKTISELSENVRLLTSDLFKLERLIDKKRDDPSCELLDLFMEQLRSPEKGDQKDGAQQSEPLGRESLTKPELLGAIVSILPTLNESELKEILSHAQSAPSQRLVSKSSVK